MIVLAGLSCKEYRFENPVDPGQTIVPPADLQFVAVSETLLVVRWSNNNLSTNYPNASLSIDLESSSNGTSYSPLAPSAFDQTSASVKGPFQTDKQYYVRARFKTSSVTSQYSNAAQFVIQFPAPTNLAAVQSSDTLVTLSWRDNSSFETGFLIEWGTDSLSLKVVDSTLAGATTKTVRGTYASGLTYYFRVRAKSLYSYSSYSNTSACSLTLNAPSNLTASAVADTAMTLGWKDNSTFETGFLIERSTDGTNYTVVDSVGANVVTKSVTGKYLVGTTYYFRVRAKSAANYSAYSSAASTTLTFPAPSNLTITSVGETSVGLQWADNTTFETGFLIERSTDGINFALVDSVGANVTTRLLAGAYTGSTTYSFRVRAKSAHNLSGYSNVSAGSPPMVIVGGGTFQMGSADANDYGYGASPPHTVTLGSFYMDKTEITYEKWSEVYIWGLTHGYTDLPAGQNGYNPVGSNNPVTNVSWYDIVKWCNARSEKDGLTPAYYTSNTLATVYRTGQVDLAAGAVKWTANGFRLPTEAEWEFAARGGTKSQGYTYSGSETIDGVAWYVTNSGNNTHPVSTKGVNELGLYDMSGNVWEWCWDWHDTYGASSQTDPKGPTSGTYRVLRGGSFNYNVNYCRVAVRNGNYPSSLRVYDLGFRCVHE